MAPKSGRMILIGTYLGKPICLQASTATPWLHPLHPGLHYPLNAAWPASRLEVVLILIVLMQQRFSLPLAPSLIPSNPRVTPSCIPQNLQFSFYDMFRGFRINKTP